MPIRFASKRKPLLGPFSSVQPLYSTYWFAMPAPVPDSSSAIFGFFARPFPDDADTPPSSTLELIIEPAVGLVSIAPDGAGVTVTFFSGSAGFAASAGGVAGSVGGCAGAGAG